MVVIIDKDLPEPCRDHKAAFGVERMSGSSSEHEMAFLTLYGTIYHFMTLLCHADDIVKKKWIKK
jgi:hypothetical protein